MIRPGAVQEQRSGCLILAAVCTIMMLLHSKTTVKASDDMLIQQNSCVSQM